MAGIAANHSRPCLLAAALADQPIAARTLGRSVGWSEATVLRELHTVKRIARQVLRQHGVFPVQP